MAFSLSLTAVPLTFETVSASLNTARTVSVWLINGKPVVSWTRLSPTEYVLIVPFMLPGGTYTILETPGNATDAFTLPVTAPWIDYEVWPLPHSKKLLEAFLFALSKELQYQGGTPETFLAYNHVAGETFFRVKSTLGFVHAGYLWANNERWQYTSKTPTAFIGLTTDYPFISLPTRTIVKPDISSILPENYTPGITNTTVYI